MSSPSNPRDTGAVARATAVSVTRSGPLPDPQTLAEYNDAVPDGANRIMKMAEQQSRHRQEIERKVINSDIVRAYIGLACAFFICMTTLGLGAYIVLNGFSVAGTFFAGFGLIGLASTFIYGTQVRRQERERRDEKNRQLTGKH